VSSGGSGWVGPVRIAWIGLGLSLNRIYETELDIELQTTRSTRTIRTAQTPSPKDDSLAFRVESVNSHG
jgi:hypothetical protein